MALVGLQTNFRDPRFQRMLLNERAARPHAALPVTGAATSKFAGQDLDTRLALARTGLESRLGLTWSMHRRVMNEYRMRGLQEQEKMLPWQIGVGIGTMGLGHLFGQRKKQRVAEQSALEAARHAELMDLMRERNKLLGGV
jgi:hypothetical protein